MKDYWKGGLIGIAGLAAAGCSADGGFPGVPLSNNDTPMDTVCTLAADCTVFSRGAAAGVVELGSLCGPLGICDATDVAKSYDGDETTCSEVSITLDALGTVLGDAVTYTFDTGVIQPSSVSFAGVEVWVNASTLELGALEDITISTLRNGQPAEGPASFADLTSSFGNGLVDIGAGGSGQDGTDAPVVAGFYTTAPYDQIVLAFNGGLANLDPADFTARVCDVITGIRDTSGI